MELPVVSIVVPVYRNADTVEELHRRLRQTLDSCRLTYEIVFVNDACPAGSLESLRALLAQDPAVVVLGLASNVGQNRAVLIGLANSLGRSVVVLDADLQDPPEAVPTLLAKLGEGYAAVFAGRQGAYESSGRLFTSRLFKRLLHHVSGVPADAGLFVAMDRRMVERLLSFAVSRPFVVAMIGWTGLPWTSVPIERARRLRGRSAYSSWGRLVLGCLALGEVLTWRFGLTRPATPAVGNEMLVTNYRSPLHSSGLAGTDMKDDR
jgi:glycosyltransferase involved in cell wall biosynthesis